MLGPLPLRSIKQMGCQISLFSVSGCWAHAFPVCPGTFSCPGLRLFAGPARGFAVRKGTSCAVLAANQCPTQAPAVAGNDRWSVGIGISFDVWEVRLTSHNRRIILLSMNVIRRVVQPGVVWLTALMTLVTGLPHFDCLCPDGHHKPFCFGFCFQSTGCCVSGCCVRSEKSSPKADATETCCSCHCKPKPSHTQPVPQAQLESQGCRKTFVQADFAIITTARRAAGDTSTLVAPVPAFDSVVIGLDPFDLNGRLTWQRCSIPPPTDLVVHLKHLLI